MKTRVVFNLHSFTESELRSFFKNNMIFHTIDHWIKTGQANSTALSSHDVERIDEKYISKRDWGSTPVEKVNEYLTLARSIGADIAEIIVE